MKKGTTETPVKIINPNQDPNTALIRSKELFGDRRQLAINHKGATYYLRITGNDKLILTK
jgi:hemin uptake protein HemP